MTAHATTALEMVGASTGPWPFGLAAAIATGILLWFIGARLGLGPVARTAATTLYALMAAVIDLYSPAGLDGWPALLSATAAWLAVGGRLRNAAAVIACLAAAIAGPVTAVGALVLLAAMAVRGGLGRGRGTPLGIAGAGVAGAAAIVLVSLSHRPDLPLMLPPVLLGALALWVVPVLAIMWFGERWLVPVAAALLAILVCTWVPGPDADAALLVAAAVPLLTSAQLERMPRLLAPLAVATASVVAVTAGLLAVVPTESVATAGSVDVEPAASITVRGGSSPRATAQPVALAIPALGLSGPVAVATVDSETGRLGAPDDPHVAGWFSGGTAPGDIGPAVLAGHVDSRSGPGVFHGLDRLHPGDLIKIVRVDGSAVRFRVRSVDRFAKDSFPTARVYAPTPQPELRLVTCGGTFDRARRSYRDNVVVEAVSV